VLVEADSPTDETLPVLLHKIINRLMKRLTRRGVLVEEEGGGSGYLADADSDEARSLSAGIAASKAAISEAELGFQPVSGQAASLPTLGARRSIRWCARR